MTGRVLALALAAAHAPGLSGLQVSSGSEPFAGDGPLLTTVSPNGDGFRDGAIVSFRLDRAARVTLAALADDQADAPGTVVWRRSERLGAGAHRVIWRPGRTTSPRTYVIRVAVERRGVRRVYDNGPLSHRAPVVRVQGIDAGFTRRSYAPGESAALRIATDARRLTLQVFAYSSRYPPTDRDLRTAGRPMTGALRVDWSAHRDAPADLRVVRAGDWPSGLYFLRLAAADGRVGYAPLVVRPRALGTAQVAVILATNTWQAYNFDDADGNGWGDSWYVDSRIRSVSLDRPYLQFGLPFRFRDWDLAFVDWLNRTGKNVDFLSDDDLEAVKSGDELARRYDLIVFPGHEEYVTQHAYDLVTRFRDLGGNLAFLAANNFFWKVRREGDRLERVALWRSVGRPEAGLVGVQYVGSDHGERQAGYVVSQSTAATWAFAGTGVHPGNAFGRYGIEIDARSASSPPGTEVLASIPALLGPGRSAEMTYYETPAGAKVFAAGALNFAASLDDPVAARLLENVWARLARP